MFHLQCVTRMYTITSCLIKVHNVLSNKAIILIVETILINNNNVDKLSPATQRDLEKFRKVDQLIMSNLNLI